MPVVVRRGRRRGRGRRPVVVAPMRPGRPMRRRRPRWVVGLILLVAVAAITYLVFRLMK